MQPGGNRVIAQALTDAPLRFVNASNGKYAVAWRTYCPGRTNLDDGKLWLLEKVEGNEYTVRLERSVFYANQVAVSNNGLVAWVRSDSHKAPGRELEVINEDGDYVIDNIALSSAAESIVFSASGDSIATLLSGAHPANQRAFVWSSKSGRNVAAFPLLLTGGTSSVKVTEETYSIVTCEGTEAVHTFDGAILSDSRFDKIIGYSYLWGLRAYVEKLPTEQLCYALERLNTLIQSNGFTSAPKHDRDDIRSTRSKILRMLGETSEIKETSLSISINSSLLARLDKCVTSGLFGSDAETVAANLLSRALDFVQAK